MKKSATPLPMIRNSADALVRCHTQHHAELSERAWEAGRPARPETDWRKSSHVIAAPRTAPRAARPTQKPTTPASARRSGRNTSAAGWARGRCGVRVLNRDRERAFALERRAEPSPDQRRSRPTGRHLMARDRGCDLRALRGAAWQRPRRASRERVVAMVAIYTAQMRWR